MTFAEKKKRALEFKTCYACDSIATSREHCPPKSFFEGATNDKLIEVRSCHKHNSEKSIDDDYFVDECVRAAAHTSKKAHTLLPRLGRKLNRDDKQFEGRYRKRLLGEITHQDEKGGFFVPNKKRIENYIALLSRGIHLHETGAKLLNNVHVLDISNDSVSAEGKERIGYYRMRIRTTFREVKEQGFYPETFYHRIAYSEAEQLVAELTFFKSLPFLVKTLKTS